MFKAAANTKAKEEEAEAKKALEDQLAKEAARAGGGKVDEATEKARTDAVKAKFAKDREKRRRRLLYHEQETVTTIHEGATFGDAIFNEGSAGRRAASIYAESALELLLLDRGPARRILKDYQAQRLKERADIIRGCKARVISNHF